MFYKILKSTLSKVNMKIFKTLIILSLFAYLLSCAQPNITDHSEQKKSEGNISAETEGTLPGNLDKPEKWHAQKNEELTRLNSNSPDSYENDDTSSQVKWFPLNNDPQERNFYDDSTDWVRFYARRGTIYIIESWVAGYGDTIFSLYHSSDLTRPYFTNDDKPGGTYGSYISFPCVQEGTYYLKVASYGNRTGTNRAYELSIIDHTSRGDLYEEDDTLLRANKINMGEVQAHTFTYDPNDYVYFYASSSRTYQLWSTVDGADTYFYLYDKDGVQIEKNDDGGPGLASRIKFIPPVSGYYYLKIYSYAGRIGSSRKYTVGVDIFINTPAYEPDYWNSDSTVKRHNNCYNYGCNKKTNTYAQPGLYSGNEVTLPLDWLEVKNAAVSDGLEYAGLSKPTSIPVGKSLIAMVVGRDDYHWYRLDRNGVYWSHKPARGSATNRDNAGNLITNPATCKRSAVYTEFGGYFFVDSSFFQGEGTETIR